MRLVTAALLPLAIFALCAPDGSTAARAESPRGSDSAAVVELLAAARGANATMCDLAARSIDQQFGWGGSREHWGGLFFPGDVALRSRDPVVYRRVRAVLGVLREPGLVDLLRSAIGDADPCVRRLAAPLLGRLQHPRTLPVLRAALTDQDPATRAMAALALGVAQ